MSRTLVIGDIHGGCRALQQVLERAEVTPGDQLIFLGDYVDGWSESSQIIQFLIELPKSRTVFSSKEIMTRGAKIGWHSDKNPMYGFSTEEKVQ